MTNDDVIERINLIADYVLTILAVSNQSPEYSTQRHIEGMQAALKLVNERLEKLCYDIRWQK